MGIEPEDFRKKIEAEGGRCQGNIHDQIEKVAEMSRTESKTENVNTINDGETTGTGVEDIEADGRKIACELDDEKQKDDEMSSTHSKGEVDNNKDIEGK